MTSFERQLLKYYNFMFRVSSKKLTYLKIIDKSYQCRIFNTVTFRGIAKIITDDYSNINFDYNCDGTLIINIYKSEEGLRNSNPSHLYDRNKGRFND